MGLELLIPVALLVLLLLAQESGFRCGRAATARGSGPAAGQIGALQGALLGLLALLLGFSFAGATSRFIERQDLIVTEANAIGTAYLRADVLDEPHRGALRASLKNYTERRVEASKLIRTGLPPDALAQIAIMHDTIWAAAIAGVNAKPGVTMAVLPPVNEVIDLHTLRVAARQKHIPAMVVGMLVACSLLAMAVMGYGVGMAGRRHPALHASLALLLCTALWTTIDLDYARIGILQLNDAPLEALHFDDAPAAPATSPAAILIPPPPPAR